MYKLDKAAQMQAGKPDDGQRFRREHGSLLDAFMADDDEIVEERVAVKPQKTPPAATETRAPRVTAATYFPGLRSIDRIGLDEIINWLREGVLWIVAAVIICIAAALAYAMVTPPRYTSYTDIIVNPSNLNIVNDAVFSSNPQRDTQLLEVESKLRTLTSRNVLSRVVSELKLDEDPEFIKPATFARFKAMFSPEPESDNRIAALRALGDRVAAERDARSFVVTLQVWTGDAEKSVTLSNAIVRSFESELFQTTAESSKKVADDLNARLEEMRQSVTAAEKKVEDFKRSAGLQLSNGELVSNQLSGELNGQVLAAQQRLIQEESRLKQMMTALAQQRAASAPIFDSETMNRIREQYNILQQQIGAMTLTYGARHPRLVSAGAERSMLENVMTEEARRILETVRTNVGEALSALDSLRLKASSERANVFTDNDATVRLRDLERDARSVAAIYETYLTRSRQIAEQQTIDSTNVRVISRPVAPNFRSWPPGKLTFLIAGGLAGVLLGFGLAVVSGLWRYLRGSQGVAPGAAVAA